MKNTIEIKKFMGIADVRIINGEWIVLKDMFNALGRVRDNGDWSDEKEKVVELLELLGKTVDLESFRVDFGKKKGKGNSSNGSIQNVECLKIETCSIVLTQFKPTKRKGQEALDKWIEFMKFVDMQMQIIEMHKYIITDKDRQKEHQEDFIEMGGNCVIMNRMVNKIMGELIGVDFEIKKDELKIYQPKTTIDLLEVRDFVLDKFTIAYGFTNSHKQAKEMTLTLALKKYPFEIKEEI